MSFSVGKCNRNLPTLSFFIGIFVCIWQLFGNEIGSGKQYYFKNEERSHM
jgi:hypothetical protein